MQQIATMTPNPTTASEVSDLIGDVDVFIVERILATGANLDEIGEALRAVEQERGFGEQSFEPSSPRVAEVRAILHEMSVLEQDDLDDEERAPIAY